MNKKGFTLVEILMTMLLVVIVGGVAVFAYSSLVEKSKLKVFKTYEQTMYSETLAYLTKHIELIPKPGRPITLSLSDIQIESINNPRNKSDLCPDSYVEVTRNDYDNSSVNPNSALSNTHVDALNYKICLICKNSDYNVNGTSCLHIPEETE